MGEGVCLMNRQWISLAEISGDTYVIAEEADKLEGQNVKGSVCRKDA